MGLAHRERAGNGGLIVIERAYRARRKVMNKADVVDLGPDHYARLAAVGRLVQILTAGRPIPKPKAKKRRFLVPAPFRPPPAREARSLSARRRSYVLRPSAPRRWCDATWR
jgi:hypothetical protein